MGDKLNAGAKEWSPNPSAKEWQPSWMASSSPAAAGATDSATDSATAPALGGDAGGTGASGVGATVPSSGADSATAKEAVDQLEEQVENLQVRQEEEQVVEDAPEEQPDEPKSIEPKESPPAPPQTNNKPKAVASSATADASGFEKEAQEYLDAIADADKREHLNVVFIGHVDAGKSTLSGSILYSMGTVDKRTIEKFEQEAKERNRESWFLAYIMDTNEEERAKGITVEVGRAYFETENRRVTILDAPGHKNYVPAMIAGASQADVGILVISARKGEFEAGFEGLGQTREHAMLAKTLGIQKLIIVVNKMDENTVKWSKDRYDGIVKKVSPFLRGCGFKVKRDCIFLPISALKGCGVKEATTKEECEWATNINGGKPLLSILDEIVVSGRDAKKPLRMTVIDRYSDRGVVVMGKVESGVCYVGQTVLVCPNQTEVTVASITINEKDAKGAKPGENVLVRLSGLNENEVSKGHVICSRYHPVSGCTELLAQVFITGLLAHRPIFSSGYNAVFHCHTAETECTVYKLVAEIDKSGKIGKKNLAYARASQTIICNIRLSSPVCLEEYSQTMQLGRFTLRDEGSSIAIGIIKRCR